MTCGRLHFSKVATALFPGLHCLPEPPSPDQEVESISSSCKPGKAAVTSWTHGIEKNQPPWLLWLGHKRQYRVSLALSWDTHFWDQSPYWEEEQATQKPCVGAPANGQDHAPDSWANNAQMIPAPNFQAAPADADGSRDKLLLPSPGETADSWTT